MRRAMTVLALAMLMVLLAGCTAKEEPGQVLEYVEGKAVEIAVNDETWDCVCVFTKFTNDTGKTVVPADEVSVEAFQNGVALSPLVFQDKTDGYVPCDSKIQNGATAKVVWIFRRDDDSKVSVEFSDGQKFSFEVKTEKEDDSVFSIEKFRTKKGSRVFHAPALSDDEARNLVYTMQKRADNFANDAVVRYGRYDDGIYFEVFVPSADEETYEKITKKGSISFVLGTGNTAFEDGGYVLSKPLDEIRANGGVILDNGDIAGAEAGVYSSQTGSVSNIVNITLNSEGTKKFAEATTEHVGEMIAIVYDGKVVSAPVVQEPLTQGRAQISGNFTYEEANELALLLRLPLLDVELEEVE